MSQVRADNRLNPGILTMLERLAWAHFQGHSAKFPESRQWGHTSEVNTHIICLLYLRPIVP